MFESAGGARSRSGAALLLTLAVLAACGLMLAGLFNLAAVSRDGIRLQIAADLAVLSALNACAESLNAVALGNRSILACDAVTGQVNAAVSEATFYRIGLEELSYAAQFIPYAGPYLSTAMRRGGRAAEATFRRVASLLIPSAEFMKRALSWEQDALRAAMPLKALGAALESVEVNAPNATFHPAAEALLLRNCLAQAGAMRPLEADEVSRMVRGTVDRRALRRNWTLKVGGIRFPVRKEGGTAFARTDMVAFDRLRVRVPSLTGWKWKRKISVTSRASDFGFGGYGRVLDLADRRMEHGMAVLLTSPPPPTPPIAGPLPDLVAMSAGRLDYLREARPEEAPNLLNPFWKARLVPLSDDETVRRLAAVLPSPRMMH